MPQIEPDIYLFVRDLARRFADAGEELFLVGGALRDHLLGEPHPDLDFATSARPTTIVRLIDEAGLGSPYRVGEAFGTIGARSPRGRLEITTYRSEERYQRGSRKPDVTFGDTLLADLGRRDFTINAMAYDPLQDRIIDPMQGTSDLQQGTLRAVGDPAARFEDDPLRLLRGVRFAARYDFAIEDGTWAAMRASGPGLESISRERIRDEYTGILTGPHPTLGLTLLRDAGLIAHSVPTLQELTRMPDHGPRHPLSLWDHTLRVAENVPAEPVVRWAALLHDIGKPATRTLEPDGRTRFFHHEDVGSRLARELLSDLRLPNSEVRAVALLVETHMQFHAYSPEWSDGAVRRLVRRLGPWFGSALALVRADAAGHSEGKSSHNAPKFDALEARGAALDAGGDAGLRSPLSGEDLMRRYGRPPGAWIGRIKRALEEDLIEGRLLPGDVDSALARADELVGREE